MISTLVLLIRRSLRQHLFSTVVTAASIALAGGLLMSVWTLREEARRTFTEVSGGYDAVLGARGSKLQLVLNAVFHLEESTGNMEWSDYLEARKNPSIERAVPLAMGDNFRSYRVVGTLPEFFSSDAAATPRFVLRAPGRIFDATAREAVVGSFAAEQLGLKRGDRIKPYHGLNFNEEHQHEEDYVVVGILQPTSSPVDRVIWIPLEGLQKLSGHDAKAATEISAVLIRLKGGSATAGFLLDQSYNKQGTRLTFAWPIGRIVAQFFDKISWFDRVLELVAYLVAVVATASVVASLYNSMNERRREIAILRALGAHRTLVSGAVVLESATITALGMLGALAIHATIMWSVTGVLKVQTGVVLNPWSPNGILILAPLGMIALSAAAGLMPALKAYRTDVAANLIPTS